MPKLSANEYYIRYLSDKLSTTLDLPYDVVRAVLDGMKLCILNDIREQSRADLLDGEVRPVNIEVPGICTINLSPMHYKATVGTVLDGRSFRPKLIMQEKFLMDCRKAYYSQEDGLVETITKNFTNLFSSTYKSILEIEDSSQSAYNTTEAILIRLDTLFDTDRGTYFIYIKDLMKDPIIKESGWTQDSLISLLKKSKRYVVGIGHKSNKPYAMINAKEYIRKAKREGDTLFLDKGGKQ